MKMILHHLPFTTHPPLSPLGNLIRTKLQWWFFWINNNINNNNNNNDNNNNNTNKKNSAITAQIFTKSKFSFGSTIITTRTTTTEKKISIKTKTTKRIKAIVKTNN